MRRAIRLAGLMMAWVLGACTLAPPVLDSYVVREGDTLYSIARRAGMEFRDLARLNNIDSSYRIYPGQVLRLRRTAAVSPAKANTRGVISQQAAPVSLQWQWPTDSSRVLSMSHPNGSQGLQLQGQRGQVIRAAAAGNVLYDGTGLPGYGRVLIVKHDDAWLSVYAQLDDVRVGEGLAVQAGQTIATMGSNAAGEPSLYFEIRRNGVTVPPLPMLQKQQ